MDAIGWSHINGFRYENYPAERQNIYTDTRIIKTNNYSLLMLRK